MERRFGFRGTLIGDYFGFRKLSACFQYSQLPGDIGLPRQQKLSPLVLIDARSCVVWKGTIRVMGREAV